MERKRNKEVADAIVVAVAIIAILIAMSLSR